MQKKILLLILLLLCYNLTFSQFMLREVLSNNEFLTIESEPKLNISISEFDSLVFSKIEIPKIENTSECRYIAGTIFYDYRIRNSKQDGFHIPRGICSKIDTLLSSQSDILFELITQHLTLDSNKLYSVIIPIKYEGSAKNDSLYFISSDLPSIYFSHVLVIAKEIVLIPISPEIHVFIDTNRVKYIPKNLEECFQQLDIYLDSISKVNIKADTEEEFGSSYHLSFGMFLRNYWGLWSGSQLSKYFNELGIYHPDDMTGIIFDSYYRYLCGKELKLNQQVKHYQDYWDR